MTKISRRHLLWNSWSKQKIPGYIKKKAEIIHDGCLTHEEWSFENGLLTATQKLKRTAMNASQKA
ncbi:long-chain fatty acid-CoA ligase [Mucor circinelloides]